MMILALDIENVFQTLLWLFLFADLEEFGIPSCLVFTLKLFHDLPTEYLKLPAIHSLPSNTVKGTRRGALYYQLYLLWQWNP